MIWIALGWAGTLDLLDPLGTDRLEDLAEVRFTFEVTRAGAPPMARSWAWRPADGRVTRTIGGQSLTFQAGQPTSDAEREADAQFVNDGFWLAPQLHVRWAADRLTVTDAGSQPLPVGQGAASRIDVRWPGEGGYTPGDGYDLYVQDGRIVAWTYRRGGGDPTLSTSFSDYVQLGPLAVATDHRSADGSVQIRFTGLGITLRDGLTTLAPLDDGREGAPIAWIRAGVGCDVRGVSVPERDGAGASALADLPADPAFPARFRIRRGDRAYDGGLNPGSLTLQDPGLVGASGFGRCDVRLDASVLRGMLAEASPAARTVLVGFGLVAWAPDGVVGDLTSDRLGADARACAERADCDGLIGLLGR